MLYELVIIGGITWAGVGFQRTYEFPTEESCFRSLNALKSADQPVSESSKKGSWIAFCAPAGKPKQETK